MRTTTLRRSLSLSLASFVCIIAAQALWAAAGMTRLVSKLDSLEGLDLTGEAKITPEGAQGERVLVTDGRVEARFDLSAVGIDPTKYDLLKIEVKVDARAWLILSLDNYPQPGDKCNWYVLDAVRGALGWKTIYADLRRPEERRKAGTHGGIAADASKAPVLSFTAWVTDTKRDAQGPGRRIRLANLRFVKKAIDFDWDQSQAPYTWGKGKDLAFTYPLTVANRLAKPVMATVFLESFDARHAVTSVGEPKLRLEPGQTKIVQATVALPAEVAAQQGPLYCERFEAFAEAEGVSDSRVTVLRSSDPIHLTVTVPLPAEKLSFPFLPRRRDIPESVTSLSKRHRPFVVKDADAVRPEDLEECLDTPIQPDEYARRGFAYSGSSKQGTAGWKYMKGLTACAFLYDETGEKKYLEKGVALLLKAAELFPRDWQKWRQAPIAVQGHGIFTANTLALGWSTGSMGPPYSLRRHGLFNDFDLFAADMGASDRQKIIDDLLVPAAIQMRNHYFGLTNQQDVVNYPILYAGLAARNWPLVSFAYSSEHGLRGQIEWGFGDFGLCNEGHYQLATIFPILWGTELMRQMGVDLYDERLCMILHSPAAKAIGKGFQGPLLDFLDANRLSKEVLAKTVVSTDGIHLKSGTTTLIWKGLSVGMNWGTHIYRGATDRCALRFEVHGSHPLRGLHGLGGGSYTHSSLGQSIIIVDEGVQNSAAAQITGVDVTGPVQFVQARSEKHFPGSVITRTFALIDRHVLVIDRVVSDEPGRTVDWCLKLPSAQLSVPIAMLPGSWTTKPDEPTHGVTHGAKFNAHGYAKAPNTFREERSRLTVLGQRNTEIILSPVWYRRTLLMVRRRPLYRNTKDVDYVAFFSAETKSLERVAVKRVDGKPAAAIGVKITLRSGKVIHALANYEPEGTEVQLGDLKTRERFATDYQE